MKKILIIQSVVYAIAFSSHGEDLAARRANQISEPLVTDLYSADASAHVFEGKIYIYPSHDVKSGKPYESPGGGFKMVDYHVYSLSEAGGAVTDHGQVLHVDDVPWANKQMWAPDAAEKNGKYYLYFPAKGEWDIFRIGVAVSDSPSGPFKPEPKPIEGSYSIDPAVFKDEDGSHYMYFGGIGGGQLQHFPDNVFGVHHHALPENDKPALLPRVVRMSDNMLEFAEEPKKVRILDEKGALLKAGDHNRRFFEAAWMHKYNGRYYFSYSTGQTHKIVYAVGDSPYGPFTYQGVILQPVVGWTTHHSICEFKGRWYLFYHDSLLSEGNTNLRSIKMTLLEHDEQGRIKTIWPYGKPNETQASK